VKKSWNVSQDHDEALFSKPYAIRGRKAKNRIPTILKALFSEGSKMVTTLNPNGFVAESKMIMGDD